MQAPDYPANEARRLQALYETRLLDSPVEERFDRITRLAKRLFGVPIALVSLVDKDRQWFKSKQGLEACQTSREISFCSHAILQTDLFLVPDASLDPRFSDNPLVTGEPKIRFYAGVPLVTIDGFSIGSFCIIDNTPRDFTLTDQNTLEDLAAIVMAEINQSELVEILTLRDLILKTQHRFIEHIDKRQTFKDLLEDLLKLTGSEYGFIGEVLYDAEQSVYLKTYALTDISWNAETAALFAQSQKNGLEFKNLNTLFGAALKTGQVIISNAPAQDSRSGGIPRGHPPLKSFMGIPIYFDQHMVGLLGIANKAGGYAIEDEQYLSPLMTTIGQLINVMRLQAAHEQAIDQVVRLSRIIHQTNNAIILTDQQGVIDWVNDGFSRLSGYSLSSIKGLNFADFLQQVSLLPEQNKMIKNAFNNLTPFILELCQHHPLGANYWVRLSGAPTFTEERQHDGFMIIGYDISPEKHAAEQLKSNEQRLSAIIEGTHIGTWEWKPQTGETLFNERWAEILGYSLAELEPISIDTWKRLTHPADFEKSAIVLQQHFDGQLDYFDCIIRMKHKAGHWVWVHDRGRVYSWSEDRKPLLMCGTQADITEQLELLEQVKQQTSFLEHIFKSDVTAITVLSEEGKLVFANAGAEKVLGLSVQKNSPNHLSYDDPQWQIRSLDGGILEKHQLPFWLVKNSGQPVFDVRHSIVWPDGQWRALSINGAPFQQDNQQMQYVFAVHDITQQILASRALEYNEFRLRSLFELAPVGIALNDFDTGRFLDVNQALLSPSGYSKTEFLDLSYWTLTPEKYAEQEEVQKTLLATSGRYGPYQKEFISKTGNEYPVLLSGVLVTDNQGRRLIWSIVEDISERLRIAQMKDEFVSTVSHELRTPLTAIAGGLDLLQTVALTLPEQMRPLLVIAQRNSKKLLGLVNDLLDMEKLLAGKISLSIQDYLVVDLLKSAIDNLQSYSDQQHVSLLIDEGLCGCVIKVDQSRFEQVITNLLSNALKFSDKGQPVNVVVSMRQYRVRIEVQDQGIGIPLAFQNRIFQKFAQADSSDRRLRNGSGLGLAISRDLVERMGGIIGFESIEGKGTTFWLELPLAH